MPEASDIAAAATGLSAVQTSVQAQVSLLDKTLESQQQIMTELLKMLGVGQNLDVTA